MKTRNRALIYDAKQDVLSILAGMKPSSKAWAWSPAVVKTG